jgi:drug/metabolite transporter (DMT)-like permease
MTQRSATFIGFTAVLLWSLLALFTVETSPVPPFQLTAICFAIGAAVGLIWTAARGGFGRLARVSPVAYGFGIAGLFGYHFCYFTALRLAPPAEAGLIAYLWPLFIVLFSGLLPGERLGLGHVAGALLAFAGVALLLAGKLEGFAASALPGFGMAFLCALIWSGYSVGSRRFGTVPTEAVTVFCAATAMLSALAHLGLERTAWPQHALGWAAILGLGLGPVGGAFFTWDIGVKRGDIQLLGTASYAAPLISTLILIAAGFAPASATILIAAALIVFGAALAARASARLNRQRSSEPVNAGSDGRSLPSA